MPRATHQRATAFRLRSILAGLTLISHLMLTVGFPLPAPGRSATATAGSFPCQGHACGCLTAEVCWAGDCCCFTLEEKLVWAEANGIEPPAHVRQGVRARQSHSSAPPQACCPEPTENESDPAEPPCCCREANTSAGCEPVSQAPPTSHQRQNSAVAFHWIVGLFAARCHGQDTLGTLKIDPCLPPAIAPQPGIIPDLADKGRAVVPPVDSASSTPPTPPPRQS